MLHHQIINVNYVKIFWIAVDTKQRSKYFFLTAIFFRTNGNILNKITVLNAGTISKINKRSLICLKVLSI